MRSSKVFIIIGILTFTLLTSVAHSNERADGDRQPDSVQVLSKEDQRILERGEISDSRYVSAGIVGSVVGFGVGHAMEHRYREPGWIFTAGESAGAGLLIAAESLSCVGDHEDGAECDRPSRGLIITGAATLAVFKIWEIIDLWVVPPQENERYRELTRHRIKRRTLGFEGFKWRLCLLHTTPLN